MTGEQPAVGDGHKVWSCAQSGVDAGQLQLSTATTTQGTVQHCTTEVKHYLLVEAHCCLDTRMSQLDIVGRRSMRTTCPKCIIMSS